MSSPWYEDFFHGVFLEVWDRSTPPELTKAEAEFLVDVLQCKPGERIWTSRAGTAGTAGNWPVPDPGYTPVHCDTLE
jgi:hypothetical protein